MWGGGLQHEGVELSGLVGLWRLDGRQVESATLQRMYETMPHRGPDGANIWSEGSVGFGHLMFHSTPESLLERQPLVAREGDLVMTADARIDNRQDLIQSLGCDRRPSGEITDSDLILAAYEHWGTRCAEHLLGDFAFAIWDKKRRKLLCARDHFGVKPLFYFHSPGRLFAFASEVKGLLTLAEVSDELDELEIARHLVIPVHDDLSATYYREVRRVQPAHTLAVSSDGTSESRYWSLDPDRSLELRSDGEYAEAVRETFLEAVRCRIRSSHEIASMLSGGIDSSSITCTAARLLEGSGQRLPLRTLSAVYDSVSESDERSFINEVLAAYPTNSHFFSADSVSPVGEFDRLNWLLDGANDAGNLYLNWNLYRSASGYGARVVLDGFDGDTTVSHGIARFVELAHRYKWWTLLWEVKAYADNIGYSRAEAARWTIKYGIKPAVRSLTRRTSKSKQRSAEAGSWRNMLQADFGNRLVSQLAAPRQMPTTEREEHYRLLNRPLVLKALNGIGAVGSGAGVEVRLPFFDVRLVKLCLSLPADQKMRGGWPRLVMRNAMEGILPEKIRWRPGKSDVSIGFRHALRSLETDRVEAVRRAAHGELSRFVDPSFFMSSLQLFMTGKDVSMSQELYFWRAFSLALWLMGRSGAGTVDGGSHSRAYGSRPYTADQPWEVARA
jgi:asparagine synthase (glutamine-hydrolysing)